MAAHNPPRRRHPASSCRDRTIPVYRAAHEIGMFLWAYQEEHELTSTEMLLALSDNASRLLKHMAFGDRHPSET